MLVVHMQLDAAARAHFRSFPIRRAPRAYRPRLARKTHPDAYVESTAGLWLLDRALGYAGCHASTLDAIVFGAHGRPRLTSGPPFSIAHSGDFAACAVAGAQDGSTRIGLDIEQHRPIAATCMARLAETEAERAAITGQPNRFFDYWCAREATVKASGRVGLKRIRQVRFENGKAWLNGQCWTLYPLALATGLSACLASDAPNEKIAIHRLSPPD